MMLDYRHRQKAPCDKSTYPHKLVLMTIWCALKNSFTGQVVTLQNADGMGHVEGFGANAVRSAGVLER